MKYWKTNFLIKHPSNTADCRERITDIQSVVKTFNVYYGTTKRYEAKLTDVFNHGFTLVISARDNSVTLNGYDVKLISKRLADAFDWMEMSTQANKLFSVSSHTIEENEFNEANELKLEQEEVDVEVCEKYKNEANRELTPEEREYLLNYIFKVADGSSEISKERFVARLEIDAILSRFI